MTQPERPDQNLTPAPLTVEGQVENVGRFARGLRTNPVGRRRAGIALAGLAVAVLVFVAVAALLS